MGPEDLTINAVVSPHERREGGKEFEKAVAILIQTFGCDIALPYLKRFQQRCIVKDVVPPSAPVCLTDKYPFLDKGGAITPGAESYLPPTKQGGTSLRCCCRPGRPVHLAQDFANAEMLAMPPPCVSCYKPVSVASSDELEDKGLTTQNPRINNRFLFDDATTNSVRLRKTQRDDMADNGFSGAIISIGPRTDALIDHFSFKAQEITKLRHLIQTERSGRWEEMMRLGKFRYSFEQASTMFEALRGDLGITDSGLQKFQSVSPTLSGLSIF
ncbi:hypothetical protein DXG01_003518 [Tephrocybe rancida]|nr:hypothetical protein DXG01_003518 [Tephrocybe rancida]